MSATAPPATACLPHPVHSGIRARRDDPASDGCAFPSLEATHLLGKRHSPRQRGVTERVSRCRATAAARVQNPVPSVSSTAASTAPARQHALDSRKIASPRRRRWGQPWGASWPASRPRQLARSARCSIAARRCQRGTSSTPPSRSGRLLGFFRSGSPGASRPHSAAARSPKCPTR